MSRHATFCHQCRRRVTTIGAEPICPRCGDGFVEYLPGSDSWPRALLISGSRGGDDPDFGRRDIFRSRDRDGYRGRAARRLESESRPPFMQLLEIVLSEHSGRRNSDVGFIFGEFGRDDDDMQSLDPSDSPPRRGDVDIDGEGFGQRRNRGTAGFFMGTGLEAFLQQLTERDGGRYGTAPASKTAVDAMPTLTLTKQNLEPGDVHCAVCKEIFETGGEARQMPCKHFYHQDCILPWLALHSSCPICRHEMPVEESNERQTPRTEESPPEPERRTNRGDGGGDFGLAILGIPGVGIRVRSFALFGVGGQEDPAQDSLGDGLDGPLEPGARASTSASLISSEISRGGVSSEGDQERERTLPNLDPPLTREEAVRNSSLGSGENRRRSSLHGFLSNLFSRNNSPSHSTTSGADLASSRPGNNEGNGTRRRWS